MLHTWVTIGNIGAMNKRALSDSREYLTTHNLTNKICTRLGYNLFRFGPSIILGGLKWIICPYSSGWQNWPWGNRMVKLISLITIEVTVELPCDKQQNTKIQYILAMGYGNSVTWYTMTVYANSWTHVITADSTVGTYTHTHRRYKQHINGSL